MPIIDIEMVLKPNETPHDNMASVLATELGKIFKSPRGTTWVKLHTLAEGHYAENDVQHNDVYPVFVKVIKSKSPDVKGIQREANKITSVVAKICNRPSDNVHVIYEAEGKGRVAFGGRLIT